jgi:glycosyltransferase involved in cell wall biosynthesis
MKILMAHNRYLTRGGEDNVFDQERDLLRANGHEVIEYVKDNHDLPESRVRVAVDAIWSRSTVREVEALVEAHRPDVLHVHNVTPQISPAIYYAAARRSVPVVQTLHNYRLLCASALLMREGRVCEDCVGKQLAWPAVKHACYRGDRLASAVAAATTDVHRRLGTWRNQVTRYIALCEFARDKLLRAGLPETKVVIKPNFAVDEHAGVALDGPRSGGLFVGRMSVEKGLDVLFEAWRSLSTQLRIIGPGQADVIEQARSYPGIDVVGFVDKAHLPAEMRRSAFIVLPSIVYEGFPMVVAEAYAAGLPIIASRLGALGELVEDGSTGLHFTPGDGHDLAEKVRWAEQNPEEIQKMGRRAREVYESRYTPEASYRRLMEIYRSVAVKLPNGE